MLNSVLKQLCVSELQVFGLAVLRGQCVSVCVSGSSRENVLNSSPVGCGKFKEAAGDE